MNDFLSCDFASTELQTLLLRDARLDHRAVVVLGALCEAPAASVRSQYPTPAGAQACYRLLEHQHVTHSAILRPHVSESIARSWGLPVVLAVQDTTAASLATLQDAEGLGPITSGSGSRGYLVHTTLLVDPVGRRPLGVSNQIVWARPEKRHPSGETQEERRQRSRESAHWAEGQRATADAFKQRAEQKTVGPGWGSPPRIIAVFDREGDVFEALETLSEIGVGFVIRANADRRLTAEEEARAARLEAAESAAGEDELEGGSGELQRLYSMREAGRAPVLGPHSVVVPRRPGRKERTVTLTIRAKTMDLRPPKIRGRKGEPLRITYVDVREENPPEGVEALHWTLMTDEPATTLAACVAVVDKYCARWVIEEFHMALKTGVGIEDRQFESFDVHTTFLAFATIVACRILALRSAARAPEPIPATEILTPVQLEVITKLVPRFPPNPTARDALRAIAGFGGFMGRKGDGEPGWRTLWWGWERLLVLEKGFLLASTTCAQR